MAKTNKNSRIAVTFHVPSTTSPEIALDFLQGLVEELFGDSASRIQINEQLSDEIMYSLQKPLLNSSELLEEFFKKLKRLFLRAVSYNPHFTQIPDSVENRS